MYYDPLMAAQLGDILEELCLHFCFWTHATPGRCWNSSMQTSPQEPIYLQHDQLHTVALLFDFRGYLQIPCCFPFLG